MDSDGQNQKTIPVVKSKESRDWWPLLAASNDKALLLWQRYVDDESYAHLCYSVYDPSKGALETISENNAVIELPDYKLKYYCYNIVYLKNLKAYAVNLTTVDNGGILLLIDEKGKIIKEIKECEDFVREAAPAVKESGSYTLYYPVSSSSVQAFEIGSDYSVKKTDYSTDYTWTYCGTAGFLDKKGNVFFASLDSTHFKKGKKTLKLVKLDLEQS